MAYQIFDIFHNIVLHKCHGFWKWLEMKHIKLIDQVYKTNLKNTENLMNTATEGARFPIVFSQKKLSNIIVN